MATKACIDDSFLMPHSVIYKFNSIDSLFHRILVIAGQKDVVDLLHVEVWEDFLESLDREIPTLSVVQRVICKSTLEVVLVSYGFQDIHFEVFKLFAIDFDVVNYRFCLNLWFFVPSDLVPKIA